MSKFQVGQQVLLWETEFSSEAYKDQYGLWHRGQIIKQEAIVAIKSQKNVQGDYGKMHESFIGYKGSSEQEELLGVSFCINWGYFPETSDSPYLYWYSYTGSLEDPQNVRSWMDAVWCLNHQFHGPFVNPTVSTINFQSALINKCVFHDEYYYPGGECFYCKHEVPNKLRKIMR